MIQGIAPLGQGSRAFGLWPIWLAHTLGGITGGLVIAGLVWLAATPLRTLMPATAVILLAIVQASAIVLHEWGLLRFELSKRQVPQSWLSRFGARPSYLYYGMYLGGGLLAGLPRYGITYALFLLMSLQPSFLLAISTGALFGLARTLVVGPANLHPALSSLPAKLLLRPPRSLQAASSVMTACLLITVAVAIASSS